MSSSTFSVTGIFSLQLFTSYKILPVTAKYAEVELVELCAAIKTLVGVVIAVECFSYWRLGTLRGANRFTGVIISPCNSL